MLLELQELQAQVEQLTEELRGMVSKNNTFLLLCCWVMHSNLSTITCLLDPRLHPTLNTGAWLLPPAGGRARLREERGPAAP